ncbi:MAG: hypothetical protein ACFFB2_08035 [Promethearchaeota archaeon]
MNEELLISILESIGVIFLFASLIIFSIIIYLEMRGGNLAFSSHNLFLVLLLTCWLIIDLISPWIFGSETILEHLTHAILLIILTIWINIRFFWAHKKAKEIIDSELRIQLQ